MSLEARAISENSFSFLLRTPQGDEITFEATVIDPSAVQRSTGTFRDPEALIDLTTDAVSTLSGAGEPAYGRVIALIVHAVSRHAAAVGFFASAAACRSWWHQPYNRLVRDPEVLLVITAIGPDL
jgi:hypothetical protein